MSNEKVKIPNEIQSSNTQFLILKFDIGILTFELLEESTNPGRVYGD